MAEPTDTAEALGDEYCKDCGQRECICKSWRAPTPPPPPDTSPEEREGTRVRRWTLYRYPTGDGRLRVGAGTEKNWSHMADPVEVAALPDLEAVLRELFDAENEAVQNGSTTHPDRAFGRRMAYGKVLQQVLGLALDPPPDTEETGGASRETRAVPVGWGGTVSQDGKPVASYHVHADEEPSSQTREAVQRIAEAAVEQWETGCTCAGTEITPHCPRHDKNGMVSGEPSPETPEQRFNKTELREKGVLRSKAPPPHPFAIPPGETGGAGA